MVKVFVDGSEGTTGLKIAERLQTRQDITVLTIDSALRKDQNERMRIINNADIVFLCLPDQAAKEIVPLVPSNVKIIDASTAHRTEKGWTYGFPELDIRIREELKRSKRVAVPGCHASGFLALVYPLVKQGILPSDYPLCCHSLTGYSGGGKKMIADYEKHGTNTSPVQYALKQNHKHLKEMQTIPSLVTPPLFSPIVGAFYSGMEVTVPLFAHLLKRKHTVEGIRDFFTDYYQEQPFIKIITNDVCDTLPANLMSGSNGMKIYVGGNDERILLSTLFDNLGKGASGAAMQCMNIMLGMDETTGLL